MKTIVNFISESENSVINACIEKTNSFSSITVDGLADDDVLFFDSKDSHKMKDVTATDLYSKLKAAGITKIVWYEYDYALTTNIRYRMQEAGFKFGELVKFNITAIKATGTGVSRRVNQIGQYIEL